ncbi:MAG: hypothetical protein JWP78_325 [Mucilaginibacter sp.]|nr:hypothetical protein [Mucilaginibacter sp.]
MKNKSKNELAESDLIRIKEIREDGYWSEKYGVPMEDLKKTDYNHGIYDKIIEAFNSTKNLVREGFLTKDPA